MSRLGRPRVIVIGELNVDIVATGLREPPQLGAEILAKDFDLTLGSASAIFATGIAKLGHPVTFVSQVGEDDFGDFCLRALRMAGVSTRNVLRNPGVKTGATISLSGVKDRALVTYPGAIAAFNHEQLKMSLLRSHQHLHMTSYFLQTRLRSSFPEIFQQARRMGLTTSFDPNSDPTGSWSVTIRKVLRQTDVLFVNEPEALHLTGAGTLRKALDSLGQLVPCAVVKRGARGAVAVQDGEVTAVPGFKVRVVDTTGAGDSFAAGFVSARLRGSSVSECLRDGNACGALSALRPGGTAAQPNEQQLRKFLHARSN